MSLASIYLSGKILNNSAVTTSLLVKELSISEDTFKQCLKGMFEIYKGKEGT